MAELQYENMTVSSLELLLVRRDDKLMELKLAKPQDQDAINLINEEMNLIANTIKTKSEAESKTADLEVPKEPKAQIHKELQIALRDNVPSFQSGVDVHSFINALELYYDLYVAP